MVFQDPLSSLDPVMRIGRQITEVSRLKLGLSRKAAKKKALKLLSEVGIRDPQRCFYQFPHELSGGMRQRIVIAIALAADPEILICDEPTTALDVTIQEGILALLKKINREKGTGILFISHNLHVVRKLCTRVAVMCRGELIEEGPVDEVFLNPQQDYTKRLIAAIPTRRKRG
jgi:ABC-type dipeptide/oligopeptide/nickel transport system ATPase component